MRKFLSLLVVLLTTVASVWAGGSNLLSGKFSVSATKQVQFTKGNLYYSTTDSKYHLEAAQNATYGIGDGTYAGTHVYHFFWANTTDWQTSGKEPWASTYSYSAQSTSDKFFCGEDNKMSVDGTSGLYALTGGNSGEWYYLINSRTNASNLYKYGVTVGSATNCLIIAPDNYSGTIAASYTAEEWATAEAAGLVCLPAAGYRNGSSLYGSGSDGSYWSATHDEGNEICAKFLNFDPYGVYSNCLGDLSGGYSVRLVKDAESTITEPEYVEIGGLRWATMNLGATTVADSPETSFGTYYSWAATSTIVSSIDWTKLTAWGTFDSTNGITFSKTGGYTKTNDPLWNGSAYTYSPTTGTTRSEGFDSYDAAKAVLGGNWRMPSADEFKALADACGSEKTYSSGDITEGGIYWINPAKGSSVTIDGVAYSVPGRLFVSSTDKTKRVFFPAAGSITGTSLSFAGTDGDYWSSSLYSTNFAYSLYFDSDGVNPQNYHFRYGGFPVRPVSTAITTEAELITAISNVTSGGTVKLEADIDLTATISVASGKNFTLDLNGHVLNAGNIATPKANDDVANVIQNNGTLTITDSNSNAEHAGDLAAYKGGILTGGKGGLNRVLLESGESLLMGNLCGGAIFNHGTLTINGGTICKNSAYRGGAIITFDGTATINGATICNNSATYGGGVSCTKYSVVPTITLNNCVIKGNSATEQGGGICNNKGAFTLKDVTISKNIAKRGGAIYNPQGSTFTVEDGTISENSAEHEGGIANFATLKLIGTNQCTITGNTSTMSDYPSGGVQIYLYDQTVTLKGKVIIKDNTTDGKTANLCLNGNTVPQQITIDGLTAGSEIGVTTMVGNNNVGFTVGAYQFTTNGSADDMQYFFSDNDKYALWYNTDHFETSIIHRADADVDAEATVNDYSMVKNYILTPATTPAYPAKNVLFINADANDSKAIDASDLTVIVDGIYNDAANKAKVAPSQPSPSGQESVEGFNVAVNGNTLTISADNASAFLAAQMDIMLPEGVTIADAQSAGHTVYNKVQEDGSTRVLIAGLQNNKFAGSAIATLTLSGAVNSEQLTVNNGIFTNTAFQSVAAAANSTTGISAVNSEQLTVNNGKYIENGKVVILKAGKRFNTAGQGMK